MNTHTSSHSHHEHKKPFWDTQKDSKVSLVVLVIIATLLVFKFGMFVGYHKARLPFYMYTGYSLMRESGFSSDIDDEIDMMLLDTMSCR